MGDVLRAKLPGEVRGETNGGACVQLKPTSEFLEIRPRLFARPARTGTELGGIQTPRCCSAIGGETDLGKVMEL